MPWQQLGEYTEVLEVEPAVVSISMLGLKRSGLPVLTCQGDTFAGRVAASLLKAIGLPELITTTLEAYEQMATDLATHPEKLLAVKRKLAQNRLATPLFDTKLFTKHIEAAYAMMHERHQAGLAPDHIIVPNRN